MDICAPTLRRSGRVVGAAVLALAVLPAPAAAQGGGEPTPPEPSDGSAVLHGRVSVAGTGEPLVHAVVHVRDRNRRAVVDSGGQFRIAGLAPGRVSVEAEYLGARVGETSVELAPGETDRIEFLADEAAVELKELQVEVERRRRGKMAGFERRREEGRGEFVTREDIEELNPGRTTQIIRHETVGARIRTTETGEFVLRLRKGPYGCAPAVFLDGVLMEGFAVNDVDPSELEAIELYEGTEVPARYRGGQGCGAVVLWTRGGG